MEKKDGTNRKLLNESRAPPRRLFSLPHRAAGVRVHAHARVPTRGSDGEDLSYRYLPCLSSKPEVKARLLVRKDLREQQDAEKLNLE